MILDIPLRANNELSSALIYPTLIIPFGIEIPTPNDHGSGNQDC
jgi:hypothetical protein